jgi:hypothetical protein
MYGHLKIGFDKTKTIIVGKVAKTIVYERWIYRTISIESNGDCKHEGERMVIW